MSEYSVEEVRAMANNPDLLERERNALIAFAKRIKAYESAVPIGWQIRIGDSDSWGFCRYECDADFLGRQSGLQYEKRPLFDHPSAQAAQVDHTMGDLAHRDAEPVVQGDPNIPSARDDLTLQLIELTEERDHLRSILAAQLRAATTAEPVAQGEAAVCIEDNSSLYRRAAGNLSMMLSLARNELHADEEAAVKKLIDELQSAQPRAVPDSWRRALERALPFLDDEAIKYEDDSNNEPLDVADTIRDLLAAAPPHQRQVHLQGAGDEAV